MIILLRLQLFFKTRQKRPTQNVRCRDAVAFSTWVGERFFKMSSFKNMLSSARKEKGIQQKDLAEAMRVVPAYVSRLEKGFSLPSNDLILNICEILEMNVQQVFLQVILEKTETEPLRKIIKGFQASSNGELNPTHQLDLSQLDDPAADVVRRVFDALAGRDAVVGESTPVDIK